ncbi:MAG: glutamate 5-kinase [Kiritimatiellaeota bacterium]|nr:glutamate 5-kinase [Kiritimatiellota bacterium]
MLTDRDNGERRRALNGVRKVVIKIGTRLLADIHGVSKRRRVEQLVARTAELRERGLDIILVSSGAIGAGMSVLGSKVRPRSLPQLQAHAAVGQSRLMYLYEAACAAHGFHSAQLLLTAADLQDRERHLNAANCLDALLGRGVLPVVNENDSVSVEEIQFGDNDVLAALTATLVRADMTIILTTVDGLRRPKEGSGREWGDRISVVHGVPPEIWQLAGGTDGNRFSTGGMTSKLRAAEIVCRSGEPLWIADGHDFGALEAVFRAEDVGTLFVPDSKRSRMSARKRFLAFFSEPAGSLTIDEGAVRALVTQGRSLLPSGVVGAEGSFRRGDTVRILAPDGREIARGVSNYPLELVLQIQGQQTREVHTLLGRAAYDEVVHRNYLVLTHPTKREFDD